MTSKVKLLTACCLMYFLFYMDRVNISSLAPIISKELRLNAFEIGIVFSAFAYPYAVFQIIGGYVGDRLRPKATLGLCGLLVGAATIWTGLADGLVGLVCARVLLGTAEGPAFPTATRALAAVMPSAERGFAQGITHSFSRLGNALTPAVVTALVAVSGWRGALSRSAFAASPGHFCGSESTGPTLLRLGRRQSLYRASLKSTSSRWSSACYRSLWSTSAMDGCFGPI